MRLTEVLLLFAALPLAMAAILSPSLPRVSARVWLLVLIAAFATHFLLEDVYWQIATCYIACLLLAAAVLFSTRIGATSVRLVGALSLLLLIASAVSLLVIPKFRLPTPTGAYPVGTRLLHLTDPFRPDSTFKGGKRELMAQAWYPTDQRRGTRAPYRRWRETTPLSSYDAVLLTHSYIDAPIAHEGAPFPILLFNPAWNGQRTQNTAQIEDLASHGFIVIAIDHPHNSSPIAYPDGQLLLAASTPSIDDFRGITLEHQIIVGDIEVRQQAADDSLLLDALTHMAADSSSIWYRAVDLNRIGAFGHSFGGAVAVQAAFQDPRILAAINLDGWIFGDIFQRPLTKPMMAMYEEDYPPTQAEVDATMRTGTPEQQRYMQLTLLDQKNVERSLAFGGGYEVLIQGAKHMNFSDRALYSPFRRFTDAGEIKAARALHIVNAYTLAFFLQTLKGTPEPLLQQSQSPFPEVRFRIWRRPAITLPSD